MEKREWHILTCPHCNITATVAVYPSDRIIRCPYCVKYLSVTELKQILIGQFRPATPEEAEKADLVSDVREAKKLLVEAKKKLARNMRSR